LFNGLVAHSATEHMKEVLPLKIRLIACCCHLSAVVWLGIFYLTATNDWLGARTFTQISNLVAILLLLFGTIPLLAWILLKKVHDFVDFSGRKVVAYHCSLIVYALCSILFYLCAWWAFFMFSAVATYDDLTTDAHHPILKVVEFIWRSGDAIVTHYQPIVCVHAINIAIATAFTLRGRAFVYPLTIPFFSKRSN
jgi:uncharacterized Tic20 family protein